MSTTIARSRAGSASRRAGYVVAVVVNAVILVAVNGWPGWEVVPFLTAETAEVIGWINASLVGGVVANSVYAAVDPGKRVKALGELATTAIGLAALVRLWEVFPFAFGNTAVDWDLVTRVLLGVGVAGSVVAIVVAVVTCVRPAPGTPRTP
ncbi:hypothetical protein [Mumia sp. DW29H23]|uniref:hypothetical protein n=1 Tax=Mumia sp. DW29H23 TaxID=3421241 RepID=UPI003D698C48